jgi:hypothetical protein
VQVREVIVKRASFSSMALGVLWPLAGPAAVRVPPALDLFSGPSDMHQRETSCSAARERSAADDLLRAHAELSRLFPDETFSRSFLSANASTMRLRIAVLMVLFAVALIMVAGGRP